MTLAVFERMEILANGAFNIEGIPRPRQGRGNLGMAMLFDGFVIEHKTRVQQPPKCERPLALKNRLERENRQGHL